LEGLPGDARRVRHPVFIGFRVATGHIFVLFNARLQGFQARLHLSQFAGRLEKIADYFEGIAEERNMRFNVDANGTGNANVIMWRRAVNNLVINAIRYGKFGTTIRLGAHADQQGSTVIVENYAEPMSQEQMNRTFNRFYRGDKSRSEYTESSGLGLAIVKAIMTLHGGSATVAALQDGLIRYSLHFPLRLENDVDDK
jgi:two-component system heavy metal sensor histidine kinase CusS